LNYSNW